MEKEMQNEEGGAEFPPETPLPPRPLPVLFFRGFWGRVQKENGK